MAVVVSGGALTNVSRPAPAATGSVRLTESLTQDYATIWRTQPAVRMVVDFLGRNVASLGLHQFQKVSATDRKRLTDDPLAELLNKPGFGVTRYRLIDALMHDLATFDNAYWAKMRSADQWAVLRIPPRMVSPHGGSWINPAAWRVRGSSGFVDIPADRVVHFHGFNADDPRMGSSPIEALRRTLVEEYEAGRMREQLLRNGARSSGYIKRPIGAPDWAANGGFERFRQAWRSQYTGGGPEAGGTPILEDGMEFQAASMNPEQLQYIEGRKLSREEVATQYFIPPPMVGILEHATFSNIEQQHRMLYQDTLNPWLEMIQQEVELQLLPDVAKAPRTYVEFNLADKLKGSFVEETTALTTAAGGPWMTRNEARARKNLPAVDGGDELITPLNVTEGGQPAPNVPITQPDETS